MAILSCIPEEDQKYFASKGIDLQKINGRYQILYRSKDIGLGCMDLLGAINKAYKYILKLSL